MYATYKQINYGNCTVMKNYYLLLAGFLFFSLGIVNAQTGPGGIGTKDGTSNLTLWLDADNLNLSDGANVTTWPDSSGYGNDAVSATGREPVFKTGIVNGKPVVRFTNANSTYLTISDDTSLDPDEISIIIVSMHTGSSDSWAPYLIKTSTYNWDDGYGFARNNNNNNFLFYIDRYNQNVVSENYSPNSYDISTLVYDNVNVELFKDGTSAGTDAYTNNINNSTNKMYIGASPDNNGSGATLFLDGDIAEIIVYKKGINDAERTIIENYLKVKYGITISNDVFQNGDASYIYDLTGVGQEADGNFMSSSSKGFYVEADAATLDNGDYIMFAHNNTSNSVMTTEVPTGVEARWARDWYVEKTGNQNATIKFDFPEGIGGQYPQNISNYVLLYRSGTTGNYSEVTATVNFGDADQVAFDVLDADLSSGYYTIGTKDETTSPLEGAPGKTWYSLASGDWDDPEIWTLDPSGALPKNPDNDYPQDVSEKVVIKNGKTVTMNLNSIHCSDLTVDGTLDFGTTTGHTFDVIRGEGIIKLAADNFPSYTDCSQFVDPGQDLGTVEFYRASYNVSNAYTFYNVVVNLSTGNTLTLLNDLQVNGDLRVRQGSLSINDNSATTDLNITVKGDVTIDASGKIVTGTANARHQFNMYGDFTNKGEVKFTNRSSAGYSSEATNGIVDANFLNDSKDQSVSCQGVTNFYWITIDKGVDATYVLDISATVTANFHLYGPNNGANTGSEGNIDPNKALRLLAGTVKLGNNINIPELSTGNNAYSIDKDAMLWVASNADVRINRPASGDRWMYIFGELRVSDNATFVDDTYSGILIRKQGILRIDGGTLNASAITTSTVANSIGAYVQTGGTVNVNDYRRDGLDFAAFHLPYESNSFTMSGGALNINSYNETSGDITESFAFVVAASKENCNVTGGTITINMSKDHDYKINSRAPFWNLILKDTESTNQNSVIIDGYSGHSYYPDFAAQPLVVLNDLTIGDDAFLDHNGQDITVGGSMSVSADAKKLNTGHAEIDNNYGLLYDPSKPNTLKFNGSGSDTLYIGHNVDDDYELYVSNLYIDKASGSEIVLKGDPAKDPDNVSKEFYNRLVRVNDTLDVKRGTLNQGRQSIRLYGPVYVRSNGILGVYEPGATPLTAYIMLKDDGTASTDLNVEDGAELGNLKLNPGNGNTVGILDNVYIKRIGYFNGRMNLRTFNLKVDYLNKKSTTNIYTGGSTDKMIFSDANASDGGLSILINQNATYHFPLGTEANSSIRYTYADVTVSNLAAGDSGYVTIRPVDGELKTTNLSGGDLLDYYWRVGYEGFTTLPTVQYEFKYDLSDDISGTDDTFYPGKVLDEDPYTRSYENDLTKVDDDSEGGTYTIAFNDTGSGFTLEKANYTAGVSNRFTGSVDQFHSNSTYKNWNDPATWLENQVPTAGSIVYIRNRNRVAVKNPISAVPAEVIFKHDYGTYPEPNSENVPRLQFYVSGTFDIGKVSGTGMISLRTSSNPTVIADFGEWANNEDAFLMYWNNGSSTLTGIIQPCPNLMIEGGSDVKIDQEITTGANFIVQGGGIVSVLKDMEIGKDLCPGAYSNGIFKFPASGDNVTITVNGDVNFNYYPSRASATTRKIIVQDVSSTLEHKLIVKGDVNLGGESSTVMQLYNTSSTDRCKVILELQGENSDSLYTTGGVVPDLYRIVLNKGSNQDSTFTFSNNFTLNGPTSGVDVSKALELQNGTLVLDDPNININLTTGDDNFEIPSTAGLEVRQGQVNASGNSGILLDGKLKVRGGSVDMSGGDNYIQYSASGNAEIEVTGGTLKVGSQVRRGTTSTEGVLKFTQTGGDVEVGTGAAGEDSRGIFEILNTGSSFTHTGGSFTIVNDYRTNPGNASFYFDPETVTLSGDTITFGNSNTNPSHNQFTIYAGKAVNTLETANDGTKLTLSVVPCTVNNELLIGSNTEFDANGLDLTLKGDFTNNGTFTASGNSTYFIPSVSNQTITGATTFYNLYKTTVSGTTLTLADDINVANELHLETGTFDDGGNDMFVQGDMYIDNTTLSGNGNDGIVANGSEQQKLFGSPTLAKLKIDNPNGIDNPTGNVVTITSALKMKQGILDIGKNLLILTKNATIDEVSPFSETNMIRTNISFTDAGVKKYFPVISSSTTFVYPMGSGTKYTPVTLTITQSDADNTYIRVKAADEIHPSVIEDSETPSLVDKDNVLQYYWVLDAGGASNFTGSAVMQAYPGDVKVESPDYTSADYITARLLDRGSGYWDKYNNTDFNEGTSELNFTFTGTNDDGIDGDYTAGIDDAIPDKVARYASVTDGNWTDRNTWGLVADDGTVGSPGVDVPAGGPKGARVLIRDNVTIPNNYITSYATEFESAGKLIIGTTFGHRLGNVSGTGTLKVERGELPAGDYVDFLSASGGTIEYAGSTDYEILSEMPEVNNIIVSGSGKRYMPNLNVQMLGDFTIDGPELNNKYNNHIVSIKGELTLSSGSFTANTSRIRMNGDAVQTITGDFTGGSAFNDFEIDNSAGVTLSGSSEIAGRLMLTDGVITATSSNKLTITNYAENCVLGSGNNSYVAGPLFKKIANGGSFVFPVGDEGHIGNIKVTASSTSGDTWEAQYYYDPASDKDPDFDTGDLQSISSVEYWRVKSATGSKNANLTLYWDTESNVSPDDGFRIAGYSSANGQWEKLAAGTVSGTSSSGSANLASDWSFNIESNGNFITFGGGPLVNINWEGDVSTDWATDANWQGNKAPTSNMNVYINSGVSRYPVISSGSDVSINDLSIDNGASLTVNPGAKVTINGEITDGNSSGGILVKNTITNPTSFIYKGTTSATATIEWTYPTDQYWYIGHSVDNAAFTDYSNPTSGSFRLFRYINGNSWNEITGTYNFDANELEGYAFKNTTGSDVTVTHTGALRNQGYSASTNVGWNLIANPYQSYIDMTSTGFDIGNSETTVWTTSHDGATGEIFYATYNLSNGLGENEGTQYIAPGQSFWLQNKTSGGTFSVTTDVRTTDHCVQYYNLKSAKLDNDNDALRIVLDNAGSKDELVLAFRYYGWFDKFTRFDSEKRLGKAINVPNIYAHKDGRLTAIGTYSDVVSENDSIAVGYKFSQSKEIKLRVLNMADFDVVDSVYLYDKVTGVEVNLRENPEYTFTSIAGGESDRFVIYFYSRTNRNNEGDVATDVENANAHGIYVYGTGEKAVVQVPGKVLAEAEGKGTIKVYNAVGGVVKEMKLTDNRTIIDLPRYHGIYIIEVRAGDKVKTAKVTRTKF